MDKRIEDNMGLVHKVLTKYFPDKSHDEDYIQIGLIGLWQAIEKYNGSSSWPNYAYTCIKNEIMTQYSRDNKKSAIPEHKLCRLGEDTIIDDSAEGRIISSVDVQDALSKLNERTRYILTERMNGRTLEDIGAELGITRERLRQICVKAKRKIGRLI